MPWPKVVDVVIAGDICKKDLGDYESKNPNQCCFYGWLHHWFGAGSVEFIVASDVARKIVGDNFLSRWTDDTSRRKSTIARAINKTTAKLGYTEGNPEA